MAAARIKIQATRITSVGGIGQIAKRGDALVPPNMYTMFVHT